MNIQVNIHHKQNFRAPLTCSGSNYPGFINFNTGKIYTQKQSDEAAFPPLKALYAPFLGQVYFISSCFSTHNNLFITHLSRRPIYLISKFYFVFYQN